MALVAGAGETMEVEGNGEGKRVMKVCAEREPELREISAGHWGACHFAENYEGAGATEPVLRHRRGDGAGGEAEDDRVVRNADPTEARR